MRPRGLVTCIVVGGWILLASQVPGSYSVEPEPRIAVLPVATQSYELSVPDTALVGDSIVSVKRYLLLQDTTGDWTPDVDFTVQELEDGTSASRSSSTFSLRRSPARLAGYSGTPYSAVGTARMADQTVTLVRLKASQGNLYLPIGTDGRMQRAMFRGVRSFTEDVTVSPLLVHWSPFVRRTVIPDAPYTNFDLIYSGRDDRSFRVTYREFTLDSLAKPALYQEAIYRVSARSIAFRNFRFNIQEVTDEWIVFTVTSDVRQVRPN